MGKSSKSSRRFEKVPHPPSAPQMFNEFNGCELPVPGGLRLGLGC